jgi:LysM repeat protein
MEKTKKSGFEQWKDTIDGAKSDKRWNQYDAEIQSAVREFNSYLQKTPGYISLDWHIIKAMVWTESGGPDYQKGEPWKHKPMQIGNLGDPGLDNLLSKNGNGDLIMPPKIKSRFNKLNVTTDPLRNIQAGIAYLLMRFARYDLENVVDASNSRIDDYTVQAGDSLYNIANREGTTVEELKKLNHNMDVLKPGEVLHFQKAAIKKVIIGWRTITTTAIAHLYNVGDPLYAQKLDYCLNVFKQMESAKQVKEIALPK